MRAGKTIADRALLTRTIIGVDLLNITPNSTSTETCPANTEYSNKYINLYITVAQTQLCTVQNASTSIAWAVVFYFTPLRFCCLNTGIIHLFVLHDHCDVFVYYIELFVYLFFPFISRKIIQ